MSVNDFNGYELSRKWFDFCFVNPERIKPVHTALYFFCIDHCNRLGKKEKFGLPTTMTMEAIGVHSYNTFIGALNDLIEFDFIEMVQKSKNQYTSNIIALSNFDKATDKALDKATIKHVIKQSESIDSVGKPLNQEQTNQEQESADKPHSKNHSKKQNSGKGKEKSSEQKESSAYTACMTIYHDWFLERYKIGPKIDALQGKSMKEIVAYISSNAKRKDDEVLTESDVNEKIQGGWKWILDNWDKLDDFRKQNTKLNQISSDIQNIIIKIKNYGQDGDGNQKGNNFGGAVADAERVLENYFGNTQN